MKKIKIKTAKELDKYFGRSLERADEICNERNKEDKMKEAARRHGDDVDNDELV